MPSCIHILGRVDYINIVAFDPALFESSKYALIDYLYLEWMRKNESYRLVLILSEQRVVVVICGW